MCCLTDVGGVQGCGRASGRSPSNLSLADRNLSLADRSITIARLPDCYGPRDAPPEGLRQVERSGWQSRL